ncbi:MAG: methyltransferase [Gammaproteobacteria bacterium]|nr:methyltransferase [Gammaproteobacteria bacterium]
MSQQCITPFGCFELKRIPDTDKNLQAWNSADLYILNQIFEWVQEGKFDLNKAEILILNDSFGALSVALSQFSCDVYSDSFISHKATTNNIKNNCPNNLDKITLLKSTDTFSKKYDLVIFKEVKSHYFLKNEMIKVLDVLKPGALILGGIMAKNLQKNLMDMLNHVFGAAQASLTWKKARLLFVTNKVGSLNHALNTSASEDSKNSIAHFQLEDTKEIIYNLANVFSRNKLDIGTRFFLQHLPSEGNFKNIIDLGCGNGVLALKAAQTFSDASITCIDESYMAVASAKMTLETNLSLKDHDTNYIAANALSGYVSESEDLILCNPPFHQQYVVGDAIAWQMFKESKKVLRRGGELWIVGNRHLGYHSKLKKIFGNQKIIATNKKFVIIKAIKK